MDPSAALPTLTVRQPWADLILSGVKDVENRSWPTRHRGGLLVHAAARVDRAAIERLERELGVVLPRDYEPRVGVILGAVEVVDCVSRSDSPFFTGPYGFTLRNPRRFDEPIPYRGRLGIYRIPIAALNGQAVDLGALFQSGEPAHRALDARAQAEDAGSAAAPHRTLQGPNPL